MPDHTLCRGRDCPLAGKCQRATSDLGAMVGPYDQMQRPEGGCRFQILEGHEEEPVKVVKRIRPVETHGLLEELDFSRRRMPPDPVKMD